MASQPQRRILVTGANSGIGLATTERLLGRGHEVLATARRDEDLAMLEELGATALHLDLLDPESIASLADAVGPVWGLVSNAGVGQAGAIEDLPPEAWLDQFQVNVFGAMDLTRRLLPDVVEQRGRLVYVSSLAGRVSIPYLGAYTATKHALEAAVDALRMEVRRDGVRVSLIEPGPVRTHFSDTTRANLAAHVDPETSRHARGYEALERQLEPGIGVISAQRVARHIDRALHSPWPRARYPMGWLSSWSVRIARILPTRLLDAIVRWQMRA